MNKVRIKAGCYSVKHNNETYLVYKTDSISGVEWVTVKSSSTEVLYRTTTLSYALTLIGSNN